MTDSVPPAPDQQPYAQPPMVPMAPSYAPVPTSYGLPVGHGYPAPVGQIRSTGVCILLTIVTLGIYQYVYFFKVHAEMKRHTGTGLGGGIALLLTFFVGIVMPYLTASEVGNLYARRGQQRPVSGVTGLWYFPGIFILVGPLVWFIKTNGALNAYWRSLGVR